MLKDLAGYHAWANERLLKACEALTPEQFTRNLGGGFPTIQATLVHMIDVDSLWLARLKGDTVQDVGPEQVPTVASAREQLAALAARLQAYTAALDEAEARRPLVVRPRHGGEYRHPAWEIVLHMVNHGTHHRGQVSTMLRQVGAVPPAMDLVYYLRERSGQM